MLLNEIIVSLSFGRIYFLKSLRWKKRKQYAKHGKRLANSKFSKFLYAKIPRWKMQSNDK